MTEPSDSCACRLGAVPDSLFDRTFLGTDDLYAEVSVDHCRTCNRNWLYYFLEFEHTSRSGRWYRGLIGPEVAFSHRNAAAIFAQMKEYWSGGSHFDGKIELQSGPLDLLP